MFIRIMQPPDCFNKGKSAPFFISFFVVTAYLLVSTALRDTMQRGRLVFCSMVRVNGVFWGVSIGRSEGKRKEK
jgi:hypothetical protein